MVRFPSEKIGVYPVTLVVTNDDGCEDSITHELIVNSVFTLYVPNAFSPNNDGENETFFAKGESVAEEEFLLRIFDRNGGVVFESTDIKEEWTGNSSNGTKLPVGVYVWKIEAKDIYSDEVRESYGYVSLIR
jgi:gliding motility-associated-like protein